MASKLMKQINESIYDFCDVIASKYKLNKDELFKLWNDDMPITKTTSTTTTVSKEESPIEFSREKIMTATKDVLMAFCKSKGLKQSGKKEDIVERLLQCLDKEGTKEVKKEIKKEPVKESSILKEVSKSVSEQSVEIRKNKFGNFEHFESGLVFNNETKTVIGIQNQNGKIDSLKDKDIETCKKYKFKYVLPENLNVDKGLSNVKVDDLDEEDEELDEDDLEEEEEDLEVELDLEDD